MLEAIEKRNYPVWKVYVQLMSPEQAEGYRWNIYDMTKVWSHKDFPLQPIGRLTMNRNVRSRQTPLLEKGLTVPYAEILGYGCRMANSPRWLAENDRSQRRG
jgi:hypothetical protein